MPLGGTDVRDDLAERPLAEPIRRSQLCHGQEPWLPGCHGNRGQRVPSCGDGWMRRGLGGEDLKSCMHAGLGRAARREYHRSTSANGLLDGCHVASGIQGEEPQ